MYVCVDTGSDRQFAACLERCQTGKKDVMEWFVYTVRSFGF